MDIYEKIAGLISFLRERINEAEFMTAYDCVEVSRSIDTPVVTVNGEYRETEETTEGVLSVNMFVPTHRSIAEAEVIFAKIWLRIKEYLPQFKALSRKPISVQNNMAVIGCSATFYPESGCTFAINSTAYHGARLNLYRNSEVFEVRPIASTESFTIERTCGYVGEIFVCDLGEADVLRSFTLEYGGYKYFNCTWQKLSYGITDTVRKAVFTASTREKI